MAVIDLWFRRERGPNKERIKTKRHGRGRRWRVEYVDASGEERSRSFHNKTVAEQFDADARAGTADEVKVDQAASRLTFMEYAERWRYSRALGQALEYQDHISSRLKHHLYPYFATRVIRSITLTDVLEWITKELAAEVARSSMKTYFDLLNAIMNAASTDKAIPSNPCVEVKLASILRGLSREPKWVPSTEQVLSLVEVVPDRYKAAIWLGAGEGMRLGEVLGFEDSARCMDRTTRELHVVQQLRFHKAEYQGFYLAAPKAGSSGTIELDDVVAEQVTAHVRAFPPVALVLPDITRGLPDPGKEPRRRVAMLMFTDEQRRPIYDQRWSDMWRQWRTAAGWPDEGTFHSLRHYFATTLITSGVDPTEVQKALRHSTLRITLETYVHWIPKASRPRSVVGSILREGQQK